MIMNAQMLRMMLAMALAPATKPKTSRGEKSTNAEIGSATSSPASGHMT